MKTRIFCAMTIMFAAAAGSGAALAQEATGTAGQSTAAKPATAAKPSVGGTTGAAKAGQAAATVKKPGTAAAAVNPLKTDRDKRSYAAGINIGKKVASEMKAGGVDVDAALVARGIRDSLTNGKPLMTDGEVQTALNALETDLRAKAQAEFEARGAANKKQGDDFLAANKTKDGVTTLPSGLQYKVLTAGSGPKPAATDKVVCNYRGNLISGQEFDSSYKRGQPATFPVNGVIKAWTEALQLMPVGSKWQLFVPPDLAYGQQGAGQAIGPNSTLIFEVELLSIAPKDAAKPAESN